MLGWVCNSKLTCTLQGATSSVNYLWANGNARVEGEISFPCRVLVAKSLFSLKRPNSIGCFFWSLRFRVGAIWAKVRPKRRKMLKSSWKERDSEILCDCFCYWIVPTVRVSTSKRLGRIMCPTLSIVSVNNAHLLSVNVTPTNCSFVSTCVT